jgi:hypothetical protein
MEYDVRKIEEKISQRGSEMANGVNVDGLRDLYKTNVIGSTFLDRAAQREWDCGETTVERAQTILRDHGTEASRGAIVDLYQQLEQLGCGKFIVGRKHKHSRFAWNVSISSVGKAAAGEHEAIMPAPDADVDADTSEANPDLLQHTYHLRRGTSVTFELPADLTKQEAERLASFIKTLPLSLEDA